MIVEALLLMLPALPGKYNDDRALAIITEIAGVTEDVTEGAVMLETAYEESGFDPTAIGDHGAAFGAYQLHFVSKAVGFDLHTATRIAYTRLHWSRSICRAAPLAPYIGGCDVPAARRASVRRMTYARRMIARARQHLNNKAV